MSVFLVCLFFLSYISAKKTEAFSIASNEFLSNGIPFVNGKSISETTINWNKVDYISSEKHAILTKAHIQENDIVFANRGNLGSVILVPHELHNANIGPQLSLIRVKSKHLLPKYLFCFFQSDYIKRQFLQVTGGSALTFFGLKTTSKFRILVPEILEQARISDTLLDCDLVITILNKQRLELQQQKKGLMQQLLTGQVRVRV